MDGRWHKWAVVGTVAAVLFASCSPAQPAASPSPTTVVNTPTATPAASPSTPTSAPPLPRLTPTQVAVPIAVVEQQMVAELVAELAPLEMTASYVTKALFDAMNPGRRLLVPEGSDHQGYTRLVYGGNSLPVRTSTYRNIARSQGAIRRLTGLARTT